MRSSLKFKLLIPYVLLILLLTLVLGWLSWWANSRTVANLTEQLMTETTRRIAQAVDRHMHGTSAVLETAFPEGMRAPKDITDHQQELTTRFYTAASIFTDPTDYVYYGNELGQGLGVQRLVDGSAQIRKKMVAEEARGFYLINGINGVPEYKFSESTIFDPRSRVWYQKGRDASNHTWTAVYLDYGSNQLVVTRARKVLDKQGDFAGVVATDLFLSELNRFVGRLSITKDSRAFIVEPDGQLISASSVPIVRTNSQGQAERVNVNDSDDDLLVQAWRNLGSMLSEHEISDGNVHQLDFIDDKGDKFFLSVQFIEDGAGLDWYAVVAVPSNDILSNVRSNTILVVVIGLLAMLLALGFGWVVFGRVASDIGQLSAAVKRTGRDLTDISKQTKRSDELGVLARSFSEMRSDLFTDRLTGVGNRMALDYGLDGLLDERKEGREPFALLFLDLNKFKPLNDTYGHDRGDLALIETANRINALLPPKALLSRLGGDEFVVVLPTSDNLEQMIQAMQQAVAEPLDCCDGFNLGVAIGAAIYPQHGVDRTSLLKYADEQMYAAKKPGVR